MYIPLCISLSASLRVSRPAAHWGDHPYLASLLIYTESLTLLRRQLPVATNKRRLLFPVFSLSGCVMC